MKCQNIYDKKILETDFLRISLCLKSSFKQKNYSKFHTAVLNPQSYNM